METVPCFQGSFLSALALWCLYFVPLMGGLPSFPKERDSVSIGFPSSARQISLTLLHVCVMLRNLGDGSQLFILLPNVYSPLTLVL